MKTIDQFKTLLASFLVVAAAVALTSCEEEAPPKPVASFTYEADGREVTFTNTSTNAKTYAWDFGDGGTSTEENPVHTYATYGKYSVSLVVTGDGGEATSLPDELTLAKTSAVVIDGDVAEWDAIPDVIVSAAGEGGTITTLKVDYDADNIYFYVEGTSNLRGFFDLYLDTDNNPETGYFSAWYPMGFGADYLSEGDFALVNDAPIFKDKDSAPEEWGWDVASAEGSGSITSSDLVTKGSGKAIEFTIVRSAFTNLSDAGFSFAVVDVDGSVDPNNTTATWAKLGSLPVDNTEESKLVFFDLTK